MFAKLVASIGLLMVGVVVVAVFGALFWALFGTTAALLLVAALAFLGWHVVGRRQG